MAGYFDTWEEEMLCSVLDAATFSWICKVMMGCCVSPFCLVQFYIWTRPQDTVFVFSFWLGLFLNMTSRLAADFSLRCELMTEAQS